VLVLNHLFLFLYLFGLKHNFILLDTFKKKIVW